jgi:hypothetical protein
MNDAFDNARDDRAILEKLEGERSRTQLLAKLVTATRVIAKTTGRVSSMTAYNKNSVAWASVSSTPGLTVNVADEAMAVFRDTAKLCREIEKMSLDALEDARALRDSLNAAGVK